MSKATKVKLDLYNVKTNKYTIFQVNISKDNREKLGKLNLSKGQSSPVKVGQVWRKLNLICVKSWQIHIPNFKSIAQKTTEKSMVNLFLQRAITPVKVNQAWRNSIWTVLSKNKLLDLHYQWRIQDFRKGGGAFFNLFFMLLIRKGWG